MSVLITVDTDSGKVQGIRKFSCLGAPFNAFLGIPFAKPPVGELRFKDPLPPVKWANVYDATQEKSCCVGDSFYQKKIIGSEDCLYLNVFTKDVVPAKLQPVMVYIHGGGFTSGSNSIEVLGPDYLLMADVVVVTINYRLGAFGFLSLKDKALNVPGNAGLKDQRMALKFIKNNIRNFGGDPYNITVFGQSAGGSSVSWHCVSDQSRGLFNKAIIMAGCVLNKFSLTPHRDWANRLAKKLGYEGNGDEKEILQFLRAADPIRIVQVQDSLLQPEDRGIISMAFGPSIEHYTTVDTFIADYPINLVQKAWSNDIDIIFGGVSDEGLMYLEYIQQAPALLLSFKVASIIPTDVAVNEDDPARQKFLKQLKETYYPLETEPTEDVMAFCKLKGDQVFWHGMQRNIRSRQASGGKGKTFLFHFAVDSPTHNQYRNAHLGPDIRGVSHADEVGYIFKSIHINAPVKDSLEFTATHRLISLLTSFAVTGDPNDNLLKSDLTVLWDPVETKSPPYKCLNIDENLSFVDFPGSDRLKIWDELYINTNTPLH